MASAAQILANRLNSQKSTGPRTDEGKAASSMNALKHCARAESLIIPGEHPGQLAELTKSYRAQYNPEGPEEELLVDAIVRADWTQRRMARLEVEVFNALIQESDPPEIALGLAIQRDAAGANALQKIFRRQEAAHRQWFRARQELARLQSVRRALEQRRTRTERSQLQPPRPLSPTQPAERTQLPAARSISPAKSEAPAPGPQPRPPAMAPGPARASKLDPPAWRL